MKLWYPANSEWKKAKEKFEREVTVCRRETDLRKFLTRHPWMLSLAFGSREGAVFSEYRIRSGEVTDHLVVSGRSLHLQLSLIELKPPKDRVLQANEKQTASFTEALRQTVSRISAIKSNREKFLKELKENIIKLADEKSASPYQGVIHENFFHVLRFKDLSSFDLKAKIVIGRRATETLRESQYRNEIFDSTGIEVMPWDRLINFLEIPSSPIEPEWEWK